MTQHATLAFIGGGNMASSLIGGLIADGWPAAQMIVAEPDIERAQALSGQFGVRLCAHNREAAAQANVIILAVKPQVLADVAQELAPEIQRTRPLVVSIAAGVQVKDLHRWLGGGELAIVRTMPNTPALLRTGATALYANSHTHAAQRDLAETLLRAVGVTVWVKEETALDSVTALSGGGPAYFFLLMEALQHAGEQLGLDAATARLLTLQTALGAAKMAIESHDSPATLRARVTSPGGTTERAIATFESHGLRETVAAALQAASARSHELGEWLGNQT
jgi:pyrroline-5-carboxylate reductase